MIQRIQTIWLMFGLLGVLFVLTLPVVSFSINENGPGSESSANISQAADGDNAGQQVTHVIKGVGHYEQIGEKVEKTENYTYIIAMVGFLTAAYLLCLFSFRNRKRQMALCWIIILFIFGLVALLVMKLQPYQDITIHDRQLGISAFLPTVSIICTLLARRAIARDEALVRSADRLR